MLYSAISKMRVLILLILYKTIRFVRTLEVKERVEVQYSSVQITD